MHLELYNGRIINVDYKDQPYFPFFWNAIFIYTFIQSHTSKDVVNFFIATTFMDLIAEAMPCPECSDHIKKVKYMIQQSTKYSASILSQKNLWKILQDWHTEANWKFVNDKVSSLYLKKKIKDTHMVYVNNVYYNPFVLGFLETLIAYNVNDKTIKLLMDFFAIENLPKPKVFTTYKNYLYEYNNTFKQNKIWSINSVDDYLSTYKIDNL